MAVINELLPPEMLERVFRLLPNRDLKNAVLVCRRWRDVGTASIGSGRVRSVESTATILTSVP